MSLCHSHTLVCINPTLTSASPPAQRGRQRPKARFAAASCPAKRPNAKNAAITYHNLAYDVLLGRKQPCFRPITNLTVVCNSNSDKCLHQKQGNAKQPLSRIMHRNPAPAPPQVQRRLNEVDAPCRLTQGEKWGSPDPTCASPWGQRKTHCPGPDATSCMHS